MSKLWEIARISNCLYVYSITESLQTQISLQVPADLNILLHFPKTLDHMWIHYPQWWPPHQRLWLSDDDRQSRTTFELMGEAGIE